MRRSLLVSTGGTRRTRRVAAPSGTSRRSRAGLAERGWSVTLLCAAHPGSPGQVHRRRRPRTCTAAAAQRLRARPAGRPAPAPARRRRRRPERRAVLHPAGDPPAGRRARAPRAPRAVAGGLRPGWRSPDRLVAGVAARPRVYRGCRYVTVSRGVPRRAGRARRRAGPGRRGAQRHRPGAAAAAPAQRRPDPAVRLAGWSRTSRWSTRWTRSRPLARRSRTPGWSSSARAGGRATCGPTRSAPGWPTRSSSAAT